MFQDESRAWMTTYVRGRFMPAQRRRSDLTFKVLIVLGMSFSGIHLAASGPTATGVAVGAGSQAVAPARAASRTISRSTKDEKSKDDKHKNDHHKDMAGIASAPNNQKAKQPKQDPPDEQNPPAKSKDRIDRKPGRVGHWKDRCTSPAAEQLQESNLCTHGPDKPPAGFKVDKPVKSLSAHVAAESTAGITCEDDGESGYRVQVLYLYLYGSTNNIDKYRSSIQAWTADMDQIFQLSSSGTRRLRFVHDAGCNLVVQDMAITPESINNFDAMVRELNNKGFNSERRIYLSYVDTTAAGICGIGTLWNDDRANGDENFNNFGPSYSRADAGCWNGSTVAHEVMHNLGGVQLSAPHTSGGYHCIDQYDVMCYSDSPNYPQMHLDCPSESLEEAQFDCNADDYYNVTPPAGSYLANHWNAANSRFLVPASDTPVDTRQASVRLAVPTRVKAKRSLTVEATVSDLSSVESVTFAVCKGTTCTWDSAQKLEIADAEAPFGVTWKAPKRGSYTFLAQATDGADNAIVSVPETVRVTRR